MVISFLIATDDGLPIVDRASQQSDRVIARLGIFHVERCGGGGPFRYVTSEIQWCVGGAGGRVGARGVVSFGSCTTRFEGACGLNRAGATHGDTNGGRGAVSLRILP